MTTAILIALNVIAGLFLVAVVLLQAGKGADMGAAFGGANPAVFGPTGQGNVLQRITAATAMVFMGTSLALAVISARQESVFDDTEEPPPLAAPVAVPGAVDAVAGAPDGAIDNAAVAPSDSSGEAGLGDAVPTPEPGAVTAPAPEAATLPTETAPTASPPAAAIPEPPPSSAVQ
jgi:preprotein translocase subunit SecG